jgi:hypothetical protein
MLTDSDLERYWKYVEKTDTCWLWKASLNTYGYGCFWWNKKQWQAHRVAWIIAHGHIPEKLLLHSCDNPRCVNPDHMREGTQKDNMLDKTSRKRQAVGERAGQAKLKEQQVLEIIEKHKNGQSMESLGRDYGVSATAVKYIVIGRNWSHLHKGKG